MSSIFDILNHKSLLNNEYGFNLSVGMIPHPAKRYKGGEDAFFLYNNNNCSSIGVADGVGGWAEQGIDSGIYSKKLLSHVYDYIDNWNGYNADVVLKKSLNYAKNNTKVLGSSTASVLLLNNGYLYTANIGDSGFLIIRDNNIIYKSQSQQHSFNYPYQIQYNGGDSIDETVEDKIPIQYGDIIILATDGLFDNIYPAQILNLMNRNNNLDKLVVDIVENAFNLSKNNEWMSPFAYEAHKNRINQMKGGKMDDITVVIAQITDKNQELINKKTYKPIVN